MTACTFMNFYFMLNLTILYWEKKEKKERKRNHLRNFRVNFADFLENNPKT